MRQKINAFGLLLCFLMSFCIRIGHQFAETHEVVAHCDTKNEKHIHDSSYHKDECSICQFAVSIAELSEFQLFTFRKLVFVSSKINSLTVDIFINTNWLFAALRAPPCCVLA